MPKQCPVCGNLMYLDQGKDNMFFKCGACGHRQIAMPNKDFTPEPKKS